MTLQLMASVSRAAINSSLFTVFWDTHLSLLPCANTNCSYHHYIGIYQSILLMSYTFTLKNTHYSLIPSLTNLIHLWHCVPFVMFHVVHGVRLSVC